MAEKIKLKHPIQIDGKAVKELSYNFDELTANDLMRAYDRAHASEEITVVAVVEMDVKYQLSCTVSAVLKANPDYDPADIYRARGVDVMALTRLGRNFLQSGAEDGQGEESEKLSPPSA